MHGQHVVTDLVLTIFRLNGALLDAGDELVRDIGLTSARWQVLGALATSGSPKTVSQIARLMGLTRQSVQRVADDLARAGLLEFVKNPDHARAKLVVTTTSGAAAYEAALARQEPWAAALASGVPDAELRAAEGLLTRLAARLDRRPRAHQDRHGSTEGPP